MKQKLPVLSFFGRVSELAAIGSYIGINENRSVLIESCKAVLECSENEARVIAGRYEVTVRGHRLELADYKSHSVEVRGVIESVAIADVRHRERAKR